MVRAVGKGKQTQGAQVFFSLGPLAKTHSSVCACVCHLRAFDHLFLCRKEN